MNSVIAEGLANTRPKPRLPKRCKVWGSIRRRVQGLPETHMGTPSR